MHRHALHPAVRCRSRGPRAGYSWLAPKKEKTLKNGPGRMTAAVLRPVAKHPAATLTVTVVALLALAAPVLGLKLTDMAARRTPGTSRPCRSGRLRRGCSAES
ncbi:hypothetical protein ABZ016_38250 [Streptomyces sp. NPDC006372]|uniref:hypothetical protein n=1 Tax=Streptomyces sp. NPDC006372 TaxID=3155599 RepID=UPI0033B29C84